MKELKNCYIGVKEDEEVEREKKNLIYDAGFYISLNRPDTALDKLMQLREGGYECSESECDSCPIVKVLMANNIIGTDITHGQYVTCSDFIEYMSERSER